MVDKEIAGDNCCPYEAVTAHAVAPGCRTGDRRYFAAEIVVDSYCCPVEVSILAMVQKSVEGFGTVGNHRKEHTGCSQKVRYVKLELECSM